jgi:hypothetical protein
VSDWKRLHLVEAYVNLNYSAARLPHQSDRDVAITGFPDIDDHLRVQVHAMARVSTDVNVLIPGARKRHEYLQEHIGALYVNPRVTFSFQGLRTISCLS